MAERRPNPGGERATTGALNQSVGGACCPWVVTAGGYLDALYSFDHDNLVPALPPPRRLVGDH